LLIEAVKELQQQVAAKVGEISTLKASNETAIKNLEGKVNHILLLMEQGGVAGK
jgi:cell division protein FtsB